jgi:hypothetical protein
MKQKIARPTFANFPEISDEKKAEFEMLAGVKVVRPTRLAQRIHQLLGGKPFPVLFVPNTVG